MPRAPPSSAPVSEIPEAAPARFEDLVGRLSQQFPRRPADEVADQAYLAHHASF